ncbi:MAG: TetR/AcrR family transcriptional regulator [Proteobacteria bacterium]|nr:TetR/AcrR family transcriptional regulator [Desulfobacula sp.]MBU3952524.1 TetR/AcrR family transcriptional regulator [Pseudomonadota bacterium]MBU4130474.1 TetR/AcrR family transcriptional regulator [Pseudomonadota bacterium]
MPPKQTITREMIVEAAFVLVRKKGLSALSARNIAKALNCSTQPIYSCYKTMEALEQEVIQKAVSFVESQFFLKKSLSDNNFKQIGLGYIALAQQEKHLFDLLYLSGRVVLDFENHIFPIDKVLLLDLMRQDPYLEPLAEEDLLELLCHMWIYTHGLTVLTRTNPSVSETFVQTALDKMGSLIIKNKLMEKGRSDYENSCD